MSLVQEGVLQLQAHTIMFKAQLKFLHTPKSNIKAQPDHKKIPTKVNLVNNSKTQGVRLIRGRKKNNRDDVNRTLSLPIFWSWKKRFGDFPPIQILSIFLIPPTHLFFHMITLWVPHTPKPHTDSIRFRENFHFPGKYKILSKHEAFSLFRTSISRVCIVLSSSASRETAGTVFLHPIIKFLV